MIHFNLKKAKKNTLIIATSLSAMLLTACGPRISTEPDEDFHTNNDTYTTDTTDDTSTDSEVYHRFFVDNYSGKIAKELYADITHDSKDDLFVLSVDTSYDSDPVVGMQIYTISNGNITSLFDISLVSAHLDGYSNYYLIHQDNECYIACHSEGVWGGLGGAGYSVYWYDNLEKKIKTDRYYETPDDLTGDALIAETNYAQELWGEYYQEYLELVQGEYLLISDAMGMMIADMNAEDFIANTPSVTSDYDTGDSNSNNPSGSDTPSNTAPASLVDISTNWGDCKSNAENRNIVYIVQTKDYNKYYDSSEWGDYEHKASVGCGICCKAMMLYSLGAKNPATGDRYHVRELVAGNGGTAGHDGKGVTAAMNANGIIRLYDENYATIVNDESFTPSSANTIVAMKNFLDHYLDLYSQEPSKYSPPMISMQFNNGVMDVDHYLLIVGSVTDNCYICVDPNLNERTLFYPASEVKTDSSSYTSPIRGIHVLYKE